MNTFGKLRFTSLSSPHEDMNAWFEEVVKDSDTLAIQLRLTTDLLHHNIDVSQIEEDLMNKAKSPSGKTLLEKVGKIYLRGK